MRENGVQSLPISALDILQEIHSGALPRVFGTAAGWITIVFAADVVNESMNMIANSV